MNGDGFDDLVIGTQGDGAFVLFGGADMTHVADLNRGADYWGAEYYESHGGDLWGLDPYFGGDGSQGLWIAPEDYSTGTGTTVAIVGDLNGDGFADIAIGAPESSSYGFGSGGSVYVVFGGSNLGAEMQLSNLDSRNGYRVTGATEDGQLGTAIAGAGDVNGDGLDDLIIAERGASQFDEASGRESYAGNAYLIYGRQTGSAGTIPADAAGDNTVSGQGAGAVVRTGAGNDTIEISTADVFRIDGGGGTDTLRITGAGVALDFSALDANVVQDIEVIDLGDGGNSVAVTPRQAAAITGVGNVLTIDGTGNATLLEGASVSAPDADGYTTYTYGGLDIRVAATVGVTQVNVGPVTSGPAGFSVEENVADVGRIYAADDNGDTIDYSIAGGADAGKFEIDAHGVLRFLEAPDYESGLGAGNVYHVTVGVSDGVASSTQAIRVTVTDVNEAPVITSDGAFSVPEGTVVVGAVVTEDPDIGDAISYELSGADADLFLIDAAGAGVLSFKVPPLVPGTVGDVVYSVTVSATDSGGLETTQDVTVTVNNVNVAPYFFGNPGAADVAEGQTQVLRLTAVDTDITNGPDSDHLTFSIVPGTYAHLFTIDPDTGELSFLVAPDYEAPGAPDNQYPLRLRVVDSSGAAHETDLVVNVTDVGSAAAAAADAYTMAEDGTLTTTLVNGVLANDTGAGLEATLIEGPGHGSLSFQADGTFTYVPEEDFFGSDSFVYAAADGEGASQATATITVAGVNDLPTSMVIEDDESQDGAEYSLDVSGNFADVEGSLAYGLSGAPVGLSIDAVSGAISGSLDELASAGGIDGLGTYELTVQATDTNGASTSQSFTLTVANPGPTFDATDYAFSAAEGSAAATVIGSVSATDDDAIFAYEIVAGNDAGLFAIDGSSGQISLTQAIDDAQLGSYTLLVAANDDQGAFTQVLVEVTLTGVNEAPTVTISDVVAIENGSFENPNRGTVQWVYIAPGTNDLPGWTSGGDGVDHTRAQWQASDGLHSIDLNHFEAGTLQQTLQTVPGRTYTVTFDLSGPQGYGPNNVRVSAADERATYHYENSGSGSSDPNSFTDMKYRAESFTFTATDSTTTLLFESLDAGPGGPVIDNVQISWTGGVSTEQDSAVAIGGLSVADPDAGDVQLSLTVAHGDLTVADTSGLTLVDGDGTDGTLVVSGSTADLNAALGGLTYTPEAGFFGSDSLDVSLDDLGNGGAGGPLTASDSVGITVHEVVVGDIVVVDSFDAVDNGSFETPDLNGAAFTTVVPGNPALTGWNVAGAGIDLIGSYWQASDGDQSIDMNATGPGVLTQTLETIPGQVYEVSFDLSGAPGFGPSVLQVSAAGTGNVYIFNESAPGLNSAVDMHYRSETFTFTATGETTTLVFSSQVGGPGGAVLDNVEITRLVDGFSLEENDVLDLSALLDGAGVPEGQAFSGGYLEFAYDADTGSTDILFDVDGGADDFAPVVTLVGVELTQADTDHYLL